MPSTSVLSGPPAPSRCVRRSHRCKMPSWRVREEVGRLPDEGFAKPLAARGIELSTPKVKAYRRTIKTPCGRFGQRDAPAYYCSATRTIYWPVSARRRERGVHVRAARVCRACRARVRPSHAGRQWHAAGVWPALLCGQEPGPALSAEPSPRAPGAVLRGRLPGNAARSIRLSSNDRYQLRVWHTYTGDEDPPAGRKPDHGSSAAQIRWLNRGLNSGDFGRCNTWTASKKSVK